MNTHQKRILSKLTKLSGNAIEQETSNWENNKEEKRVEIPPPGKKKRFKEGDVTGYSIEGKGWYFVYRENGASDSKRKGKPDWTYYEEDKDGLETNRYQSEDWPNGYIILKEDEKQSNNYISNPYSIDPEVIEALDSVYQRGDEEGRVETFANYTDVASLANQLPEKYKKIKDALISLENNCSKYMKNFNSLNQNSSKYESIDDGGFDDYYLTDKDIDNWIIFEDFINDPKINKNV